jgi:hypothetical protein
LDFFDFKEEVVLTDAFCTKPISQNEKVQEEEEKQEQQLEVDEEKQWEVVNEEIFAKLREYVDGKNNPFGKYLREFYSGKFKETFVNWFKKGSSAFKTYVVEKQENNCTTKENTLLAIEKFIIAFLDATGFGFLVPDIWKRNNKLKTTIFFLCFEDTLFPCSFQILENRMEEIENLLEEKLLAKTNNQDSEEDDEEYDFE